ncbi:unnamed protein product [Closterium sp. Naga37s-1]|nr:unnamed protein product [Closterium sp. Naga37s-1]
MPFRPLGARVRCHVTAQARASTNQQGSDRPALLPSSLQPRFGGRTCRLGVAPAAIGPQPRSFLGLGETGALGGGNGGGGNGEGGSSAGGAASASTATTLSAARSQTPDRPQPSLARHVARSLPVAVLSELVAAAATAGGTAATAAANSGLPAHAGHLAIPATAVTPVAVTALAAIYGAYLSDNLLGRQKQPPKTEPLIIESVDVTDYPIFRHPEVLRAVEFARDAHWDQYRKTGEPYVNHCVHTARILAALVPPQGKKAVDAVVAAVLHDIVDDTPYDIADVEMLFGADVAQLVDGVSRLSHINQLLRRHRRATAEQRAQENTGLSSADVDSLRMMLLGMVNDPRVVLIKLADRLHNMRTIYALKDSKARAVAQETLSIWCSLASLFCLLPILSYSLRLLPLPLSPSQLRTEGQQGTGSGTGDAVCLVLPRLSPRSELEDLCFAVLEVSAANYTKSELATMWSSPEDWRLRLRPIPCLLSPFPCLLSPFPCLLSPFPCLLSPFPGILSPFPPSPASFPPFPLPLPPFPLSPFPCLLSPFPPSPASFPPFPLPLPPFPLSPFPCLLSPFPPKPPPQPRIFRQLRGELATMWSSPEDWQSLRGKGNVYSSQPFPLLPLPHSTPLRPRIFRQLRGELATMWSSPEDWRSPPACALFTSLLPSSPPSFPLHLPPSLFTSLLPSSPPKTPLQPRIFRQLRGELATMWSSPEDWRSLRERLRLRRRPARPPAAAAAGSASGSAEKGGTKKGTTSGSTQKGKGSSGTTQGKCSTQGNSLTKGAKSSSVLIANEFLSMVAAAEGAVLDAVPGGKLLQGARDEEGEEGESEPSVRDLIEAVVPFDLLADRNRRSRAVAWPVAASRAATGAGAATTGGGTSASGGGVRRRRTRVMRDAEVALTALHGCEEALQRELLITTPYVPGMEIVLSGRLKSMYSCHAKMRRKRVPLDKIYDARALRVVVGDANGTQHEAAVEACYNLLSVVHSLWTPIGGEFDDYILNPKPSGYQTMHEYAEFGHAAHWLYKESDTPDSEFGHAAHWLYKESDTPDSAPSTEPESPSNENAPPVQSGSNQQQQQGGSSASSSSSSLLSSFTSSVSSFLSSPSPSDPSASAGAASDAAAASGVAESSRERRRGTGKFQPFSATDFENQPFEGIASSGMTGSGSKGGTMSNRGRESIKGGTQSNRSNSGSREIVGRSFKGGTQSNTSNSGSTEISQGTSRGGTQSNRSLQGRMAGSSRAISSTSERTDAATVTVGSRGSEGEIEKQQQEQQQQQQEQEEQEDKLPATLPQAAAAMPAGTLTPSSEPDQTPASTLRSSTGLEAQARPKPATALVVDAGVVPVATVPLAAAVLSDVGEVDQVEGDLEEEGEGEAAGGVQENPVSRLAKIQLPNGKVILEGHPALRVEDGNTIAATAADATTSVGGDSNMASGGISSSSGNSGVDGKEAPLSSAARINNKVRLLRSMLQWEREVRHEAAPDGTLAGLGIDSSGSSSSFGSSGGGSSGSGSSGGEGDEMGGERDGTGQDGLVDAVALSEVLVISWPGGEIVRLPAGSLAGDFARLRAKAATGDAAAAAAVISSDGLRLSLSPTTATPSASGSRAVSGSRGYGDVSSAVLCPAEESIFVNGKRVDPSTRLRDGDLVEVRCVEDL